MIGCAREGDTGAKEENRKKRKNENGGKEYVQKRNKRPRNMSGWHCSRYLSNSLHFAQCRRVP